MNSLLIGVFENENENILTKFGQTVDQCIKNEFFKVNSMIGLLKFCKSLIFYDLTKEYPIVVFVGLGSLGAGFDKQDDLFLDKENVRKAVSVGIKIIKKTCDNVKTIFVDDCQDPFSVGESVELCLYNYKDYNRNSKKSDLQIFLHQNVTIEDKDLFLKGRKLGYIQNISRFLSESPSNFMTPTDFVNYATKYCTDSKFKINIHDIDWAKSNNLNAFLAVAQGSKEPLKFLEIHFKNCATNEQPLVLVGKGITFDSGGISLKSNKGMDTQRADMSGGACVLSVLLGISDLDIKGYFIGLIPLCENMPSGESIKPGDTVKSMSGKTIQINNTDAEGRLILSDTLTYSDIFNPKIVIDIATLTGAAKIALGQAASAVFSTNDELFDILRKAGQLTGDRVWRMPLYSDYGKLVSNSILADVVNQSKDTSFGGSSCVAAAFLNKFTKCSNWIHIDMASTKQVDKNRLYMNKGMSGGPVRTLIKFIELLNK